MAGDRPIFVSILSVLHTIGGLIMLCMAPLALVALPREVSDVVGMPPLMIVFYLLILGVVGLVSGIGMWMGTRWGWWWAAFYYIYAVARAANALMTAIVLSQEYDVQPRTFVKFAGRIVVNSLIFLYFCNGGVRQYFDVEDVPVGLAVVKIIGIIGLLAAPAALWTLFS